MRYTIILLLVFLNYSHTYSQNYNGDQNDLNKILLNSQNFSKYIVNSNYKRIRASYTMDAKIFPNDSKIIEGLDSIINYWKLPEDVTVSHHKIFPSEVTISGNTAYDYGYYEGVTLFKNGKENSWKGKYVIVWKKINNSWKIYLDIWNNLTKNE